MALCTYRRAHVYNVVHVYKHEYASVNIMFYYYCNYLYSYV